ncbi:disease resistance RPP13-like protein 4 [Telopea speciosissima]|uniref:disease resistance RPP13-like protein 4 n=1 Tax=Telopea speciosissima TaxID=54955 RepID=UPI001CC818BD|nr:disease resistance RPP13-like protein 4 [Telopea speciosissima]XP_043714231.1 disease resistance RPP13-like protein 4 [Telopea speciosissima]
MVDAVVSVFLDKLFIALQEHSRIVTEFRDQFDRLKGELQLMQSFLRDVDRLKRKHQSVRTITVRLRELVYEAEDILADCRVRSNEDEEVSTTCLKCFSPLDLPFHYQTGKRLREINEEITVIKQNISSYLGVTILPPTGSAEAYSHEMSRWSSPVYDHTQVVGLEADTQKLKEWLFEANSGLLAIGIVGMGGLGKTTTAQKVFNDREVENHFDRRMWVSVSQTFTEEQILRSMLKHLGDASVGDDRGELLRKINQYLQGQRYLIVMDDVWREDSDWWQRICHGLPKGNGGSVIITTRIEKVARKMGVTEARIHCPKFLSENDSWLLFRKVAFAASGGECGYPELESVGKEIVEKCKGLPLAIKAVGGIMLCKLPYYDEWRRIAENFREELAENDDSVMASLQLSYDELPSYLKSCFLCFSLYPEDCVITKEQLVHWWIGEGFVLVRNGRLTTVAAEDCFSGLTNRCLVEVVDKTYNGIAYTCKIHDMVRDLLIKMMKDDESNGASSHHLGLRSGRLYTNSKLRALLSTTKTGEVNKFTSAVAKKFSECRYLRVLDLSKSIFETHLPSLLDQIGLLQHLTYLSLSNTHPLVQLPHSLEKLSNLEILDVSYCHNLKILPSFITTLEKLTILDVSYCGSLEYLPKGLGRLSNLQELLGFRPARSNQLEGCCLAELKSLIRLRKLELRLTRGDEIGDDEVNVLLHLQQLQFLTISCFDSHGCDLVAKMDKLSPPQQLHELRLKFFPGEMSPTWLNPISLPMLRYLSICSGNMAKMNQRFWGTAASVWKIEGLMLESLSDLEGKWSAVHQAMPSLRIVTVSWCPKLESFPIEDVVFRGGVWKKEEQRI